MPSLPALTWRCLLIVGLVFNPVAGMGVGAAMASEPAPQAAKAPPCHHGMVMQAQVSAHGSTAPCGDSGKECGHFTCKSGACCLVGSLDLPAPVLLLAQHGSQSAHSYVLAVALPPPPSRMIRPPIG
jgi:hypothetical protein